MKSWPRRKTRGLPQLVEQIDGLFGRGLFVLREPRGLKSAPIATRGALQALRP
jgi:hypothetical protein